MPGGDPSATQTTAPAGSSTTSTTATEQEARPAPSTPAAEEAETEPPATPVESDADGEEDPDTEPTDPDIDESVPSSVQGGDTESDESAPSSAEVSDAEPGDDMSPSGEERPDITIRFTPGSVSATESGTFGSGARQTYTVYASEGQAFTATLRAPPEVSLDVRLAHLTLASAAEGSQIVEAELPATGAWQVTVVSAAESESDYELAVELLPLPALEPTPTTTTPPPAEQPVTSPPVIASPSVTPDGRDIVYLTFDDGPNPVYTPQILDILARHGARATFFVVGALAQANPDIIERIAAEGHTLANHTWRHEDLTKLSREAFDETIGRTEDVLGHLATPCLRPPYGAFNSSTRQWAGTHGLAVVTWDSSPEDWLLPPAEEIADHIVSWARPGVVLLMHDGGGDRSRTVEGLRMAMERLSDQDLSFEPLCH